MSEAYGGLIVDVVESGLDRVSKILAGIPGGVQKAVGSALARAGRSGRTVAARAITKEYAISYTQVIANVRNINRSSGSGSSMEVTFGYAGNVIPLVRFDTTVSGDGYVQTRVKQSSSKEILDRAFQAQVGAHTGIFERVGDDRFPIKELFGPAVPQMMYSNEDVMDEIENKVVETYQNRIDHEITRILNGGYA